MSDVRRGQIHSQKSSVKPMVSRCTSATTRTGLPLETRRPGPSTLPAAMWMQAEGRQACLPEKMRTTSSEGLKEGKRNIVCNAGKVRLKVGIRREWTECTSTGKYAGEARKDERDMKPGCYLGITQVSYSQSRK
jgi:hypothetical protein